MLQQNKLLTFHIDDIKFTITKSSLNNFPNSRLAKIINGNINDNFVYIDKNNVYVNKDPRSFVYIIDILRGYDVNLDQNDDPKLRKKIETDIKYFGLDATQNNPEYHTDNNHNSSHDILPINNNIKSQPDDLNKYPGVEMLMNLSRKAKNSPTTSVDETTISEIPTNETETDVFKSNNNDKINRYIENIEQELKGSNSTEIMNKISNNSTLKGLISTLTNNNTDSDVESLDMNETEDRKTSELITDISHDIDDSDEIESLESIINGSTERKQSDDYESIKNNTSESNTSNMNEITVSSQNSKNSDQSSIYELVKTRYVTIN
jgi:hypothetical protein